ncbi:MAG: DNA topoisomerase VI subunit B [Promethearchaeota archaeon]
MDDQRDDQNLDAEIEEESEERLDAEFTSEIIADEEEVQMRSPAEFFHENKSIAGFDNSLRVVFTSIRELVENGLDAAEKARKLPDIRISLKRLNEEQIGILLGSKIESLDRHLDFLQLSVEDNGIGIMHDNIPPLFGRVLTGSNYQERQTRGRFGLGAKMVLLNAMATVDLPIQIVSRHFTSDMTSVYCLFIDLRKNEPVIEYEKVLSSGEVTITPFGPASAFIRPGTRILVTFTGSWALARNYVKEYLLQLSIITPYARIEVELPDEEELVFERVFQRLTDEELAQLVPKPTKIHPSGCDITQLKRLIAWTNYTDMFDFLKNSFQGIRSSKAKELLDLTNIDHKKDPKQLTSAEIRRIIHEGFTNVTFQRPDGSCLSPISERMLIKGLEKAFEPEFITAVTRKPSAYSGFPFIVEVAMAYGGKELNKEPGIKLFRYANRIPLLFGEGNDISKRVISGRSIQVGKKRHSIDWKKYGLNINTSPLAIAVSIVSTRIPFPETSKEYIASVDEIAFEILQALRKAGSELRTYLGRKARASREKKRKSRFIRLAPELSRNLLELLKDRQEIVPFELDGTRVERALASGKPMNVNYLKPPSASIKTLPNISKKQIPAFREHGIVDLYDLVRIPKNELADFSTISSLDIQKLKTQYGTDIGTYSLFSPDEIRFLQKNNINTLEEVYYFKKLNQPILQKIKQKLQQPVTLLIPALSPKKIIPLTEHGVSSIYLFFVWASEDLAKIVNMPAEEIISLKKNFSFPTKTKGHPFSILSELDEEICKAFDTNNISIEQMYFQDATKLFTVKELIDLHSSSDKELPYHTEKARTNITDLDDKLVSKSRKQLLAKLDIRTGYDFLKSPSDLLAEKLTGARKNNFIENVKSELGISLESILYKNENLISTLRKMGIYTIEDLYFYPSYVLGSYGRLRRILNSSIDFLRPKISNDIIETLYQYEISTLIRLYFYPLEKLAKILNKSIKEIMTLKDHLPFALSLADTFYTIMESPVSFLEIPHESIKALNLAGINRIVDFIYWPSDQLNIPQLTADTLNQAKTKINILSKGAPIDQFEELSKNQKLILVDENYSTFESIYFVAKENSFSVPEITWEDVSEIKSQLAAPITRIVDLPVESIGPLEDAGITRVIEFLYFPSERIEQISSNLPLAKIEQLKRELKIKEIGTPVSALSHFGKTRSANLEKEGYSTVEDIYFATDKETFNVEGVQWSQIELAKAILRAPITINSVLPHNTAKLLMNKGIDTIIKFIYWPNDSLSEILDTTEEQIESWKVEIDTKSIEKLFNMPITLLRRLGSNIIEILMNNGINTLEKWFQKSRKELSQLINLSVENIQNINAELDIEKLVSRTGIPIGKIIFDSDLLRSLNRAGIKTIEDLYFSTTSEEDLDSDEIEWETISNLRNRLECPVSLFHELRPFEAVLKAEKINSVIEFLYRPSAELEKYLGISKEEIDQLKEKMDLESLSKIIGLPISFMTIPIDDQTQLSNSNIQTLGDFLVSPNETLSQIIGLSTKEIDTIKSSISIDRIRSLIEADLKLLPVEEEDLTELFNFGLSTIGEFLNWKPYDLLSRGEEEEELVTYLENDIDDEEEEEEPEQLEDTISYEKDIEEEEEEEEFDLPKQHLSSEVLEDDFEESDESVPSIEEVTDLEPSSDTTPTDELERKAKKYVSLQQKTTLRSIEQILFAPILFIPSLSPIDKQNLILKDIKSVFDLLNTSIRDLAAYMGYSMKNMGAVFDNIRGREILTQRTSHGFPLSSLQYFSSKALKTLENAEISSVEEILTLSPTLPFISDKLEAVVWKKISQLQEILLFPITYSPALQEVPADLFNAFLEHNIVSIYQLFTTPLSYLEEKCNYSSSFFHSLREKIQVSACPNLKKNAIKLTKISKGFKTLSDERGITTIDELLLTVSEDEVSTKVPDIDFLSSAICLTPELPSIYVWRLFTLNINTIGKFLVFPNQILSNIMNIDAIEIAQLKARVTLNSIKNSRKAQSFPLLEIAAANKRITELLQTSVLNTPADIYFVLYRDKSQPGWVQNGLSRFIEVFDLPIINVELSSPLSPSTVIELTKYGIDTIIKFIYWSASELAPILNINSEEVLNLKKTIELASISRKKRKTGFPVSDFYNKEFASKLEEIGIYSLEGLLVTDECVEDSISSEMIQTINATKELLNSSITHIPEIERYILTQLKQAGISKIYEFLIWYSISGESLAEKTGLGKSVLRTVTSKLNEKLLSMPKGTQLDLVFSSEQVELLKHANLNTLEEYFFASNEILKPLQASLQRPIFTRIKLLLDLPAVTLQLPEELNHISTKGTIYSLLQTTQHKLEEIAEDLTSIKASVRKALFELYQIVDAPLTFIPDLPLTSIKKLEKESIWRIIEFISVKEAKLSEITKLTRSQLSNIKKGITPENILASKEKAQPISLLESDSLDLSALKNAGIETIDEIYFLRSEQIIQDLEVDISQISKIQEILEYGISYHPKIRSESPEIVFILQKNGIDSIFYFYVWDPIELCALTGLNEEDIAKWRSKVSFSEITDLREKSLSINTYYPSLEKELDGYQTVEDVLFSESFSLQPTRIQNAFSILMGSVAFIPEIPLAAVQNLFQAKIGRIIDFLLRPSSKLAKLTNLSEKKLNSLKNASTFDNIQQSRSKGTPILALIPLGKKPASYLESSPLNTIQDFYTLSLMGELEMPGLNRERQKTILEALELSILYLEELILIAPQIIKRLVKYNVKRIIDFFIASDNELANLTGLSIESIQKIRQNINLRSIRRKSPGNDLKILFNEATSVFLESNGWTNIEDLYILGKPPKADEASVQGEVAVSTLEIQFSLIERVNEFFQRSITKFSSIEPEVSQKCLEKEIETVIDFFYWPVDDLSKITGLSKKKTREYKKIDLNVIDSTLSEKQAKTTEEQPKKSKKPSTKPKKESKSAEKPSKETKKPPSKSKTTAKTKEQPKKSKKPSTKPKKPSIKTEKPPNKINLSPSMLEALKKAKSKGTPLSAYFDEKSAKFLEANGILTLEGIYSFSEDFGSIPKITPQLLNKIENARKFIGGSIDQHPSLSPKTKEKLKSSNITTILGFLLISRRELIEITKLPKKDINELRRKLKNVEEPSDEPENVAWPTRSKNSSSPKKASSSKQKSLDEYS